MADPATVTYTAAELLELANASAPGQPLTVRTLRYYTSLQLVDPPVTRQGQPARYTDRHVHQLEFVRRRRAAGRGLAEIAAELATGAVPAIAARPPAPTSAAAVPDGLAMPGADGTVRPNPSLPSGPPAVANARVATIAPGVQVVFTGAAIGDDGLLARLIDAANRPRLPHLTPANGAPHD
jgi:hypothetical protein